MKCDTRSENVHHAPQQQMESVIITEICVPARISLDYRVGRSSVTDYKVVYLKMPNVSGTKLQDLINQEIQEKPLREPTCVLLIFPFRTYASGSLSPSCPVAHVCIISKMGKALRPSSVKLYSTRGGTSGYTVLDISPSFSNSLSCCVSIFWLTPGTILSNSL